MRVKGIFSYNKAIILDEKRMVELDKLLNDYCGDVDYCATIENGRKITFESFSDLLSYENYGKDKIISLSIHSGNYNYYADIDIETNGYDSFMFAYKKVFKCVYCFDSKEKSETFESAIIRILEKSKASYWLIGKVDANTLMYIPCFLITIYNLLSGKLNGIVSVPLIILIPVVIGACVVIFALNALDRLIHKTILMPIVFLWGEEEKRFSRTSTIRTNILWCLIIALVVGIIAGIISGKLLMLLSEIKL